MLWVIPDDLAVTIPQFNRVTVNELFCLALGLLFVCAKQVKSLDDVSI
jgi:hypothetical protein